MPSLVLCFMSYGLKLCKGDIPEPRSSPPEKKEEKQPEKSKEPEKELPGNDAVLFVVSVGVYFL